jgi:hypothetical protein
LFYSYSSFIIVTQPSIPDCVAATKYEKMGNTYAAKLYARIVCLLDPGTIERHFTVAKVGKNMNIFIHKI